MSVEARNLEAWEESGDPYRWVWERDCNWDHAAWLQLLERLRQGPYWPMREEDIGKTLEVARKVVTPVLGFKVGSQGDFWGLVISYLQLTKDDADFYELEATKQRKKYEDLLDYVQELKVGKQEALAEVERLRGLVQVLTQHIAGLISEGADRQIRQSFAALEASRAKKQEDGQGGGGFWRTMGMIAGVIGIGLEHVTGIAYCPHCREQIQPGASYCPHCTRRQW